MTGPTQLLSLQQVATILGVSTRTVQRLVGRDGGIPEPIRVGCSARWKVSDLEKYIEKQATKRGKAPKGVKLSIPPPATTEDTQLTG